MSDCEHCGRETNNAAITTSAMKKPDPLKEFNGIIWLCDSCLAAFLKWLGEDADPVTAEPPVSQSSNDEEGS